MKDSYVDVEGDEYSANSQVRCGQSEVRLGFMLMTQDDTSSTVKSRPRTSSERRRFLPSVPRKR